MAFPLYFDEDSVNGALIRALLARGMDVTNAIDAVEQMRRILRMNRERSSEDMRDQVEFLSAWE